MREFHNPTSLLTGLASPLTGGMFKQPKIDTPQIGRDTRSAAGDEAAEEKARKEAAEAARRAAASRTGRRQSILSPSTPASTLSSGRKSLLGSNQ